MYPHTGICLDGRVSTWVYSTRCKQTGATNFDRGRSQGYDECTTLRNSSYPLGLESRSYPPTERGRSHGYDERGKSQAHSALGVHLIGHRPGLDDRVSEAQERLLTVRKTLKGSQGQNLALTVNFGGICQLSDGTAPMPPKLVRPMNLAVTVSHVLYSLGT